MTAIAVALFGSRARGDHKPESDTDILLVVTEGTARVTTSGTVSLSIYPIDDLATRAQRGDLFTGHLVIDAQPLYDPTGFIPQLRGLWKPKDDYSLEIRRASDLATFLMLHQNILAAPAFSSRRIAWCVKTILIAHSVAAGRPAYSDHDLASLAGDVNLLRLLELKTQPDTTTERMRQLGDFLTRWGIVGFSANDSSVSAFVSHFVATGNEIALKTLAAKHEYSDDDYGG
ncbi:MAG: nucleotidyltransferase domain-containing protein [Parasphingorhabdus sp.]|nr:nucleotidyltransferase domain-containing protein [Sphingorhabdus sp. YGSMI21]ATW03226.1 hypothetical protein CHN51_06465 [Sphingorhabdus sp. YGSMI21]